MMELPGVTVYHAGGKRYLLESDVIEFLSEFEVQNPFTQLVWKYVAKIELNWASFVVGFISGWVIIAVCVVALFTIITFYNNMFGGW